MAELSGCFGFCMGEREKAGGDLAGVQSGKRAGRQKTVNSCGHRRIDIGAVLASVMFLLEGGMKEGTVLDDGSADRSPDAIAVEVRFAGHCFNRIASVKRGI